MTIKKRLARSNIAMFVIPVLAAAVLLLIGLGIGFALLERVYLPQLGISLQELHQMGEAIESLPSDSAAILCGYAGAVAAAMLLTIAWANYYLTRNLFRHISKPLDTLTAGVARIRDGDLDTPIAYREADEFRAACDAVDEMAARLKASLEQQQRERQKKQELIAGMSHDLKSPLTSIRAYTEALLDGVAREEAAKQRYLQTIHAKEAEIEAMVNRLFEFAKMDVSEYPVRSEPLPLRETLEETAGPQCPDGVTLALGEIPEMRVLADRELLGRIVSNLLDNSRKYGGREQVRVTVSAREADGMAEICFADGTAGLSAALNEDYDLLLLDLMLPGTDGFTICRAVRERKDIPILMVTALGKDVDKIRGLGFGADDYIEKPFSPSVLVARVKAHLAQYQRLKPQPSGRQKRLTVGALTADPEQRLIFKNGRELALKNKEYELLLFLMRHPGQVFSREDLYEMIWGLESMGDNVTVAVHVNRLREKIEDDPSHSKLLQTVWGVGYRLSKGER